ncbi:ComEA family DNA-binding protein [Stackebrandtia albiflava]|uniref:ComEA family DNA-binding protein n=1 Tax=Stackebrandtia albiflava TaxID=406432 RepID=UPI001B871768|nr:helix-hairpin-helix domain-containing protein [Stackebrandtia albiflava]
MNPRPFEGAQVLVLGTGSRAQQARGLLTESGATVVWRYRSDLTYVVIDRTVPAHDPALVRAQEQKVPVLTTSELRERLEGPREPRTMVSSPVPPASSATRSPQVLVPPPPMPPMQVPPPMVPLPPRPAPPPEDDGTYPGWVWATAVVFSAGLLSPVAVGYAAWRVKSPADGLAALGYLAVSLLALVGFAAGGGLMLAALLMMAALAIGGGSHAFYLWQRIARGERAAKTSIRPSDVRNSEALAAVNHRRKLREDARELAANDPVAARELRIGRPDLPRRYDDGGLVDFNSAPVAMLMTIPGMTRAVAEEIRDWRDRHGPFSSMAEVVIHTDIEPKAAEQVEQFALFMQ